MPQNILRLLARNVFHQLYTRFAFTYDTVSRITSRGEWAAWTRAAIPFLQGKQVLEIAAGTGNFHLALYDAGYSPIAVDLSPFMLDIARNKFRLRSIAGHFTQASVFALPFPDRSFTSLVMTFPPGFVFDGIAMRELWRVLEPRGILIWVDAPYFYPRDLLSRGLNILFNLTGVCARPSVEHIFASLRAVENGALLALWQWRVVPVEFPQSRIHVFLATKRP